MCTQPGPTSQVPPSMPAHGTRVRPTSACDSSRGPLLCLPQPFCLLSGQEDRQGAWSRWQPTCHCGEPGQECWELCLAWDPVGPEQE